MSEEAKTHRPTTEIQQEYQKLAFQAGNLQYEITCKNKDLAMINDTMRNLNFEYMAASEAEKTATPPSPPAEAVSATEGSAA